MMVTMPIRVCGMLFLYVILLILFAHLSCIPNKYVKKRNSLEVSGRTHTDSCRSSDTENFWWNDSCVEGFNLDQYSKQNRNCTINRTNYSETGENLTKHRGYNYKSKNSRSIYKNNNYRVKGFRNNSKCTSGGYKRRKQNCVRNSRISRKDTVPRNSVKRLPRLHTKTRVRKLMKYRIRRGDALIKISKRFGISIKKLCRLNKLRNKNNIKTGMILRIPVRNTSVSLKKGQVTKRQYFRWPLKRILNIRSDGIDGVKSIGIIITGKPGAPVRSSASGVVKKIGRMRGFGRYVVLKHRKRFITVYSNLEIIGVHEGERVRAGTYIGRIKTNNSKLHFQINCAGKAKNPLRLLPKRGLKL